MNRPARLVAAGIAVVIGLGALAACTADEPAPSPTSPTETGGPNEPDDEEQGWTRAEVAAALFDGDVGTSVVLGSVEGAVPDRVSPQPALVEVTEVVAGSASTLVRFTLRNVDGSDPLLALDAFNTTSPLVRDIRDVALVVTAENRRLQPFLGSAAGDQFPPLCTCSAAPLQMSQQGQLLSATFPPLDADTEVVSVELPGFPLVEDLPVRRD